MRVLNPNQATAAAVVGLVATGLLVVSWRQLPEWRAWSQAQQEEARLGGYQRFILERNEFHHCLTVDLAKGRVSLAQAIELLIRKNAQGDDYLEVLRTFFPAPSLEESVARNLLLRVEGYVRGTDPARTDVLGCLTDEYASIFGRRPPPHWDRDPEPAPEAPARPGSPPPDTMTRAE